MYGTICTYVICKRIRMCIYIYIYTYVRIYIYVCLLCIEVHTYIYNYVYLLYPSVAPRFDRSPPVSVATSRQLPHPAEIDRASSRRSPSPAGNWPPGDHFTRKKCWENAGNMVISPSNNIDMGRLWFHQKMVGKVRFNWLNIKGKIGYWYHNNELMNGFPW